MGLPERLLDRQLAGRSGDLRDRLQSIRVFQRMQLAVVVMGLLAVVLNLASSSSGFDRYFWAVLGALWVGLAYVLVRQWRYLDRRRG